MQNHSDTNEIKTQLKTWFDTEALFGVEDFAAPPSLSSELMPLRADVPLEISAPKSFLSVIPAKAGVDGFTSSTENEKPWIPHQVRDDTILGSVQTSSLKTIAPRALSTADKKQALDALYAKYANCQNCELGATRKKIVFGVGALDPKVLFVGEGPGFEEDRQGLPFVGKAGQLLDKIMASIGLTRDNCYIANIVKCHPMKDASQPEMRGNDRAPSAQEASACRPILNQQIKILQPPIICTLGSPATKELMQTTEGISRLRGNLVSFTLDDLTIPLLPTYHPAALLRNEELKKDVWQDMKLLRSLINS